MAEKYEKYLKAHQEVSKAISSTLSLHEVLDVLVTHVKELMDLKACAIRLLNPDTNRLEMVASHGLSEKYINKGPVDADKSITDAMSGKTVSVYDVTSDSRAQYQDASSKEGIKSIVSVPLKFKEEVIGVLRMYTSKHRNFTEDELNFVVGLSEQGAIAIQNARLHEKIVSKERQFLKSFQEVSKAVTSTLAVNDVLNLIVTEIARVMELKACAVRLLDEKQKTLELVASHGLSESYIKKGSVDADKSIAESLEGSPVVVHNAQEDPRAQYPEEAKKEGIFTIVSVPIIIKDKLLGVMRMYTGKPRVFSKQDLDFACSLAEMGGVAIENARIYERIRSDYESIMSDIYQYIGYRKSI